MPWCIQVKTITGISYLAHQCQSLLHTVNFNVWSAYSTLTNIGSGLYIGDSNNPKQYFAFRITDSDLQRNGCNKANSTSRYWAIGGVMQSLTVEFYTDSSFDPYKTRRFNCYVLATIFMLFMLKALALALMNIVIFFL